MHGGLFGAILGGSLGYSSDPDAARNISDDERFRLLRSAAMAQMPAPTRQALLRDALASQNTVPVFCGPPERPVRPSLRSRLARWFFQS